MERHQSGKRNETNALEAVEGLPEGLARKLIDGGCKARQFRKGEKNGISTHNGAKAGSRGESNEGCT
jgi:hypothetical protein